MRRATKGVAAMVSGTIEAVLPIEVPTMMRVSGIIAMSSIMKGKERRRLTTTSSTR